MEQMSWKDADGLIRSTRRTVAVNLDGATSHEELVLRIGRRLRGRDSVVMAKGTSLDALADVVRDWAWEESEKGSLLCLFQGVHEVRNVDRAKVLELLDFVEERARSNISDEAAEGELKFVVVGR